MSAHARGTSYTLKGPQDAPVVALIHGVGINRRIWSGYEATLSERYRVLSYDLYGHGESAPPPATLSLRLFATQLVELLDALDVERCALVGFSLGGMINRRFAMDHPGRAAALVILNSPHERSPEAQRLVEERVARTAQGGPAATAEASLERWFTPGFLAARADVVDEVRAWIVSNDAAAYTQGRRVLARGVVELIRPQPPIALPALVMTCENDSGSTPDMARGIAAEIAGARVVIVPRLQHLGMLESPSLFLAPILDFLDETVGPGARFAKDR